MANNKALVATRGMVVSIHFTLTDDEGDVIDTSDGEEAMLYLHGSDNIVPGLEKHLEGKTIGDKVTAVVPPAEGYGEADDTMTQAVPLDEFPDDITIEPGMQFVLENDLGEEGEEGEASESDEDEGELVPVWVVDVDEEEGMVYIDTQHPLAGETLHFDVEIVAIRPATAEELEHGHPHGPGDDHHH